MKYIFLFLLTTLIPLSSYGQQRDSSKIKGMNYMVISPNASKTEEGTKEPDTQDTENKEDQKEGDKERIKEALVKPLLEKQKKFEEEKKAKEYFTPQKDLHSWPHLRSLLSSDVKTQVLAVQELEKAPEFAPPMALLLTSEFYFKQGKKESAALYLLASQLRSEFDMKRWPIMNDSGLSARHKEHPARETLDLSNTLSNDLSGWIFSNKERATLLFEKLKKWDADTPFAYLPTYDLHSEHIETTDIDTWKDLHDETRSTFIEEQTKILSLLHP